MSIKQDRAYARTAQDIERKYGLGKSYDAFGKTFAETLGIADDRRNKVNLVESSLKNDVDSMSTTLRRTSSEIYAQAKEVNNLSNEVELKLDAKGVSIAVAEEIAKGIEVETGYKFDNSGLQISKSGTDIKNLIDQTGMYVKKSESNVLVANKDGVEATDLHAKTYLIIGAGDGRSRFEDYGVNRTGCFWVGG